MQYIYITGLVQLLCLDPGETTRLEQDVKG